jgi:hypothetical protein
MVAHVAHIEQQVVNMFQLLVHILIFPHNGIHQRIMIYNLLNLLLVLEKKSGGYVHIPAPRVAHMNGQQQLQVVVMVEAAHIVHKKQQHVSMFL